MSIRDSTTKPQKPSVKLKYPQKASDIDSTTKVLLLIMLLSTFRLMFHSSIYLSLPIYVVYVDLKVSIYGFWNKITLKRPLSVICNCRPS